MNLPGAARTMSAAQNAILEGAQHYTSYHQPEQPSDQPTDEEDETAKLRGDDTVVGDDTPPHTFHAFVQSQKDLLELNSLQLPAAHGQGGIFE
ncbi:unnamed protein product, partial [Amoebophrya sp. A120]|eukprot:GSA120T00023010001.1